MYTSPFTTYIDTTTSDEETGYYEFLLGNRDTGWYACDAWYEEDTDRWEGSSTQFYWDNEDRQNFIRDIYMYLVE